MKIRLLTSCVFQSGVDHPGDVVDYPDDVAGRLLRSGQAEAFTTSRADEEADVPPLATETDVTAKQPEQTTNTKARRQRR